VSGGSVVNDRIDEGFSASELPRRACAVSQQRRLFARGEPHRARPGRIDTKADLTSGRALGFVSERSARASACRQNQRFDAPGGAGQRLGVHAMPVRGKSGGAGTPERDVAPSSRVTRRNWQLLRHHRRLRRFLRAAVGAAGFRRLRQRGSAARFAYRQPVAHARNSSASRRARLKVAA